MKKKINSILKEVLEKVTPSKDELNKIKEDLDRFLKEFKKRNNLNVEVFVGGSLAKNTLIKKDVYDADIFVRFDKKYKDSEISGLTNKILKKFTKSTIVHGSRDYFKVKLNPIFYLEIIPVIKVKNPKNARNITDLSYSHVKDINQRLKSKKILDEIRLAKAFCYANNCYGAESYIKGFSGYSLELLVYHYGSFLKFIKEIVKNKDKVIIDIEKHYKNKQNVLMDINNSKLQSPIILIDPTYKQRNALAALSYETFEKFKKNCRDFLKNPSLKSFEVRKIDLSKIKKNAIRNKLEFILIKINTNKQEGDVAGTKLLKFHNHLTKEIEKFFLVKNNGFLYNQKKSAECFFVVKSKKEILHEGPNIKQKENIKNFKKKHKNTFIKKNKIYAKEKITFNIKKFILDWKKKNNRKISEMYIKDLKII
jgi:tRNA nucleotidyltransferase (CCA-adding enzyme)|tara:strand:+ start:5554 stop:6822 length:1269 start_codon:yes stop_codon:yes gene_type:complete